MHLKEVVLAAAGLAFVPVVSAMKGTRIHPVTYAQENELQLQTQLHSVEAEDGNTGCIITLYNSARAMVGMPACIRYHSTGNIQRHHFSVGADCDTIESNLPARWYFTKAPAGCT